MDGWWQRSEDHIQDAIRALGPRRCTAATWQYDTVQYTIDGPVASVKLNDIRGANGLTQKTTSALTDLAVELHGRPDVKVIVFTAGGAYFCTGGAFGGNAGDDDYLYAPSVDPGLSDFEKGVAGNMPTALLFYLLNTLPQYKVAAIRGKSMGAGNSLIASMDYVVAPATKKTGLSFLESTRALSFCMSWQGILSKVGVPKARSLVLISDDVDAYQGKECGIVDEVVEGASAEATLRLADQKAMEKGAEVARLPDDEIRKLKTTGPGGTKTKLLAVPTGARGCQALQGHVPDYKAAVEEVISKCGRTGRPAPARLSKEMWGHQTVQLERCGQHMAVIRLTNAEAGNALSKATVEGLLDALIELHKSVGKVRLVCVRAEGSAFCSGLEQSLPAADEQLQQMLFLFWMLPMYVLGFVEGKVSGHGIALCSTFDAVAATMPVVFDFEGLTPDLGGEFVSARIGAASLKELVGNGAKKTAGEAKELGIVSKACSGRPQMTEHLEYVCDRLSQCAPNAVADSKAALQTVGSTTVDMSILKFMSTHIAKRNLDPEFNDAILAISLPTHKPAYNRHEHNAVLPQHKAADGGAAPPLLKDKEAARPRAKAKKTLQASVMI